LESPSAVIIFANIFIEGLPLFKREIAKAKWVSHAARAH